MGTMQTRGHLSRITPPYATYPPHPYYYSVIPTKPIFPYCPISTFPFLSPPRHFSQIEATSMVDTLIHEESVYMAELAEPTEHCKEMVQFMEKVVVKTEGLSVVERNIFFVTHNNVIDTC